MSSFSIDLELHDTPPHRDAERFADKFEQLLNEHGLESYRNDAKEKEFANLAEWMRFGRRYRLTLEDLGPCEQPSNNATREP